MPPMTDLDLNQLEHGLSSALTYASQHPDQVMKASGRIARFFGWLRTKLSNHPDPYPVAALDGVIAKPGDSARQTALTAAVRDCANQDPTFAAELRAQLQELAQHIPQIQQTLTISHSKVN